jgi:hypothetical protein
MTYAGLPANLPSAATTYEVGAQQVSSAVSQAVADNRGFPQRPICPEQFTLMFAISSCRHRNSLLVLQAFQHGRS